MWREIVAKKLERPDGGAAGSETDFKKASAFGPVEVEETKLGKNFLDQT